MSKDFLAHRSLIRVSKQTGEREVIEITASDFRLVYIEESGVTLARCDLLITGFMSAPIRIDGIDFFHVIENLQMFNGILKAKSSKYDFFWPDMEPYLFDEDP